MPVRDVAVRTELRAAPLQQLDERDRLAVERRVLGRRRRAEVRLQRDVAEILQRDDAERVGVARASPGTGSGICRSSSATLANGSDAKSIGPACSASTIDGPSGRMIRKYRRSDASPVSGTTRGVAPSEAAVPQVAIDPIAQLDAFGGSVRLERS